MEITAGLVGKVGLGLGVVGAGATGIYVGVEYLNNSLSYYDTALIYFLEAAGDHDIKFEVKKGTGTPGSFADSDVVASEPNQAELFSARIQVNSTVDSIFKKGGAAATDAAKGIKEIKELNKKSP